MPHCARTSGAGNPACGAANQASGAESLVLVERYLAGPQDSVEAISENGEHVVLAVTRKYSDPRSMVEIAHVLPAALDDERRTAIATCASDVLTAVDLRYGPSHTEIVWTPDGPMPIETHARVGGDDIWLMVHAATGVDLDEMQADQIFADSVLDRVQAILAGPPPRRPYQAVWFVLAAATGHFAGLRIPPEVAGDPHVTVSALVDDGAPIRPAESSNERVVKVRASGTSAAQALESARAAAEKVAVASGLNVDLTQLDIPY